MRMLGDVVGRSMGLPAPAPSHFDVAQVLKARLLAKTFPAELERAASLLAEGRLSAALGVVDRLAETIDTLPTDQRGLIQSSELVRQRLTAELRRAEALFALDRLDESQAAYEAVMRRAAEAGQAGVQFFGQLGFTHDGLRGIARVELRRGRASAAAETSREVMRRAVATESEPQPPDRNNLGKALLALGQPRLALEQFVRARAAVEPEPPNPHNRFGEADALRMLGDETAAAQIYADALREAASVEDWLALRLYADRLAQRTAVPEAGDVALLDGARRRAAAQGETPRAMWLTTALLEAPAVERPDDLLHAARETIRLAADLDANAPSLARLRVALARTLLARPRRDRDGEARALLDDALSTVSRLLDATPIDARRAEIAGDWIDASGAMVELLRVTEPDEAFAAHERAKAPALVARLGGAAPQPEEGIVPGDLLEREAELRRLALSLQDDGAAGARSQAYRIGRLTDVRAQLRDVEDRIAAYAPEYIRRRRGVPTTPAEIRRVLGGQDEQPTAVVSFFVDRDATTAFVLGPGDVRAYRCDVGRSELEALVASMRRAFNGDAAGYPPIRRNRPWARDLSAWAELGPRLLGFTEDLDGVGTIVIAPHGPLHLLPLHALRLPDGRFLAERFAVSYTPTVTALEHLIAGRARAEGRYGDVYVAGVASRADAHPEHFERDAELFASPAWRCSSDIGPERASRERVLAAVGDADVVHVTCHGEFAPGEPGRSGLLFSDGSERPPRALQELSPGERVPFLVSVSDLLRTPMRARLVTLRACSTGLQTMRHAGDEFDGLTRALLEAGAHSALVSLWNVDQQSSRELLARFYAHWTNGAGAAHALAVAQRELLDLGDPVLAHPYHWAPFALIGDWR